VKQQCVVRIFPLGNDKRAVMAIICAFLLVFRDGIALAQVTQQQQVPPASSSGTQLQKMLPPEQLDSLLAPIALYPDALLSQVLVASTYPLEIIQADRWLKQNASLKGKALTDAAAKQPWDASIQALVVFPAVLKQLDQNINWTTELGNAFLAQQGDVMDAVQRLRQKAEQNGKLASTPQQQVTTTTENNASYIEIQPTDPQVMYVPEYNPAAIWGPPPAYYPYPPVAYPYAGDIFAASVISFGAGVAVGALVGGSGWGWGAGWGSHSVVVNNNFVRNNHFNNVNVANGNQWRHNPAHRAGVPYNNRAVANRFNQVQGRPNVATRPNVAQTQQRLGQAGQGRPNVATRPNVAQTEQRLGQAERQAGRGSVGQRGVRPGAGQGSASRAAGVSSGNRIGGREVSGGNFGRGGAAFGDMNMGGGRAHMNANRGFSSAGRGGGGFGGGRGGGGRGGGGRGGGGRGGGGRR
jgi:hypothetical protein